MLVDQNEELEECLSNLLKEIRKSNSHKEQLSKNGVTKTEKAVAQPKASKSNFNNENTSRNGLTSKDETVVQSVDVIEVDVSNSKYIDLNCPHCDEVLSFTKHDIENGKQIVCPFCNESFRLTKR